MNKLPLEKRVQILTMVVERRIRRHNCDSLEAKKPVKAAGRLPSLRGAIWSGGSGRLDDRLHRSDPALARWIVRRNGMTDS